MSREERQQADEFFYRAIDRSLANVGTHLNNIAKQCEYRAIHEDSVYGGVMA